MTAEEGPLCWTERWTAPGLNVSSSFIRTSSRGTRVVVTEVVVLAECPLQSGEVQHREDKAEQKKEGVRRRSGILIGSLSAAEDESRVHQSDSQRAA